MTKPKPSHKKIVSIKDAFEASRCRRRRGRKPLQPASVTCWSGYEQPVQVTAVEVDSFGARVVLPWDIQPGETVKVSLSNAVGEHFTVQAKVVWAQPILNSARAVAGLCFEQEATLAA